MADDATQFHERPAEAGDLEAVRALLREADLPVDGLEDQFPVGYDVVTRAGRLVAAAGVEIHGRDGLIRSVVVDKGLRGRLFGERLTRRRIQWSREQDLDGLWLLTTTAARFFARLGFVTVERASAPAALQASKEFASACPESATCMRLDLRGASSA